MRLRNNPKAETILKQSKYVIQNEKDPFFKKEKLYLEIGMGKGDFIVGNAVRYIDRNYVGIEKFSSVQIYALEKIKTNQVNNNLMLLSIDALDLKKFFSNESIDGIYLNFSDPWPKKKHRKRRLTSFEFLSIYFDILKKDGFIEIKTDQKPLFNFTIEQLKIFNSFEIIETSIDLHKYRKDIITTEYEKKFLLNNNSIFYINLKKQ